MVRKPLREDDAETLKAVCRSSEEQSIVRDLLDTGMTLKEALKKKEETVPFL